MKILSLNISNILRINAARITPSGRSVVIGGNNENGKTSVLDSILLAIGGRFAKHKKPLREGKKKGKIEIDLGELTVTRTFTERGGGTLTVTSKDGSKISSPQGVLDKLYSHLSFDPLAWCGFKSDEQVKILKQIAGIDFEALDQKRKELYDERTSTNRSLKTAKATLAETESFPDAPDLEVSVSDLVAELCKAQENNWTVAEKSSRVSWLKDQYNRNMLQIAELQSQIETLTKESAAMKVEAKQIKASRPLLIDEAPIQYKLQNAEAVNVKVRANQFKIKLTSEVNALQTAYDTFTESIESIDSQKAELIANAKFPIPDLCFDESGVTYKGIPFEQCSSEERLRVSIAMGIAMNPELKVLLVRDGSLLDDKNLALIQSIAETSDYQLWLERVGKGEECTVIIEDGYIENPTNEKNEKGGDESENISTNKNIEKGGGGEEEDGSDSDDQEPDSVPVTDEEW